MIIQGKLASMSNKSKQLSQTFLYRTTFADGWYNKATTKSQGNGNPTTTTINQEEPNLDRADWNSVENASDEL